jgi:hypothetical protein
VLEHIAETQDTGPTTEDPKGIIGSQVENILNIIEIRVKYNQAKTSTTKK